MQRVLEGEEKAMVDGMAAGVRRNLSLAFSALRDDGGGRADASGFVHARELICNQLPTSMEF